MTVLKATLKAYTHQSSTWNIIDIFFKEELQDNHAFENKPLRWCTVLCLIIPSDFNLL